MKTELITLGAGCFWCVDSIFSRVKGIESVTSGYTDGNVENPSYQQVCSGITEHAEVVQLVFDPTQLSVEQILTVFFAIHDPTTLNRQGDDIGSQYRSTILYHNDSQKLTANKKIAELTAANAFEQPIVTQVKAASNFYSAEAYHQDYFNNNQDNRYCQLVVAKKIQKFLTDFSYLLKD